MRFHSIAVICALAAPAVDAFGVPRQQVTFAKPASALRASDYDFLDDDMFKKEKKKYTPPPKKTKIADVPAPAPPAPAPAPVPEPAPVKAKKVKKEKVKAPEPAPAPVPEPEPVKEEPKLKKSKKKVEKPAPVPPPAPVVAPAPAPAPVAKAVVKDANPGIGLAAGAAPLIAAPVLALVAGRSTLMKTQSRREGIKSREIELTGFAGIQELAAEEAKQQSRAVAASTSDVDGATLGKAVVSRFMFVG